ncbi:MAG: tetratricopeptide repeat protein [Acidobacteria bacterium]|nr:tetratricopeptide repeat protein [Acidobacteriota bacterium]
MFWYRKSANQGDASGQLNLGQMYSKGDGVPKDLAQAAFWYRKSADQGNAPAQSNLGAMYATGKGVPKDLVIAYMWRNLAAAQGNAFAKEAREVLEQIMTPAQIAEGQRLSRAWKPKP